MKRMKKRIAGMLRKRQGELALDKVEDPRAARGKRWKLPILLTAVLVGIMGGAKGLGDVEELTTHLSGELRRLLGIARRIPDTTLRNVLCALTPESLRPVLHRTIRAAHRRKALEPSDLPFGVVSLDGKGTALRSVDDHYAQRQTQNVESGRLIGSVRTLSAVLTSSPARPYIDVRPVHASTTEMGAFPGALRNLVEAYRGLDLFKLVTYDAGACSLENATLVREFGLHYLFGLKLTQPTLLDEAKLWLAERTNADATTEDIERGKVVTRRAFVHAVDDGFEGWDHLRTFIRVRSETRDPKGKLVKHEERYFLSSLPTKKLTSKQWLAVIRGHWGVETAHQVLDVSFEEDDRRWIESKARGHAVVGVLRRIAYTLLTLYRSVTLRSDDSRTMPWKRLIGWVYATITTDAPLGLSGLSPPGPTIALAAR